MRLLFCFLIGLCLLLTCNTLRAQVGDKNPVKIDTVKETIIYEYDTLFVAPDTIRLTDTIYRYQQQLNNKPVIRHRFDILNKINLFSGLSDKWSAGIGFYSYLSGLTDHTIDSLSIKQTLNFDFEFHVNYQPNKMRYTVGIGYRPVHEQLQYLGSTSIYNKDISSGIRDSSLIGGNCSSKNYYSCFQLFFNIGRSWGSKRIFFVLDARFSGAYLINYKAILPGLEPSKISSAMVDKYRINVGLYPSIGYKLQENLSISLVPFCAFSPNNTNKYPAGERIMVGIGLRVQ